MTVPPRPGGPAALLRRTLGLRPDAPVLAPLCAIAGAGAVLAAGYAFAAGWLTPQRLTPARVIDGFQADFGQHPGFRRNHAKGICVVGHFDGSGLASAYSSASVFQPLRVPVIGRFAVPGGNPAAPDTGSPVRSLALEFQLPGGEQWRTGMNNTPIFVVNTPKAFYENLLASRPDPATGKPDPARLKAFFDSHPESAPFRAWTKAHPGTSSLLNTAFYSINAFRFVDAHGQTHPVRWSLAPELPAAPLEPSQKADKNALQDDLLRRLAQGPARWHLQIQLAAPGDPEDDATRAWPADRPLVDAGVLTLERAIDQGDGPCRDVNFDPTILPRGIQVSNDPLLAARSGAYSRSYNLRTHEVAALQNNARQGGAQ
ncbi:catalase family peroxidase [Massilia sp. 9096]|uniref:catalase family peroxidase n=1 Tax=Massilia sp. 9096 TaxID=1500894 RepID=UPI0009DE426D|nr:catalase family peroxidase [Massilia sp. 9096]